ncbi:MAG: formylglycine-generating enzyme family protein [Planctomycetota bacterium]
MDQERWARADAPEQDACLGALCISGFALLGAERFACAGRAYRVGVFRHERSGARFHLLPGAPRFRVELDPDPFGEVPIPPLLVARAPLSRAEWEAVPGAPPLPRPGAPELPAGGVSWLAARAWCAAAGLRLPREVEWEHAARAGARTRFFWGDEPDDRYLWHLRNAGGRAHAAAEHAAWTNAFGLIDVAGNVWEWCQDDLDLPMEGSAWQEGDPGKGHRGGSFEDPPAAAACSLRRGSDPRATYPDLGLRPVADLEKTAA